MAKWKAPADAGPGVSVGGEFFPIVDGYVITPDDGNYQALAAFGYVQVEQGADETAAAADPHEIAPAPVEPEPETPAEPEPEAEEPAAETSKTKG